MWLCWKFLLQAKVVMIRGFSPTKLSILTLLFYLSRKEKSNLIAKPEEID